MPKQLEVNFVFVCGSVCVCFAIFHFKSLAASTFQMMVGRCRHLAVTLNCHRFPKAKEQRTQKKEIGTETRIEQTPYEWKRLENPLGKSFSLPGRRPMQEDVGLEDGRFSC